MALNYKLDHVVKFIIDKNYWCLAEFGGDEKQVGENQKPWPGSFDFTVQDLAYQTTLEQGSGWGFFSDKSIEQQRTQPVVRNESLLGRLVPERAGGFGPFEERTRYSFFGTKREIAQFTIEISQGDEERINVWGLTKMCPRTRYGH